MEHVKPGVPSPALKGGGERKRKYRWGNRRPIVTARLVPKSQETDTVWSFLARGEAGFPEGLFHMAMSRGNYKAHIPGY